MEGEIFKRRPQRSDYITADLDQKKERINSRGQEKARFKPFGIWYIEPVIQFPSQFKNEEDLVEGVGWVNDQRQLREIEKERMEEVRKDKNKRPFWVHSLKPTDLLGELKIAYEYKDLSVAPELILIREDKDAYQGGIGGGEARLIRETISKTLKGKELEDKEKFVQPIIAVITSDPAKKEILVAQGADLVINDFSVDDIKNLVQLAAKIKSDPAFLEPEKVKEEKKKFYEKVKGLKMENRVEITADTEKELKMLNEIIEQSKVRRILDVGSGSGRIANRLAQNEKLLVTGIEVNRDLIAQAEKNIPDEKNVNYIQGDLIDYRNNKNIKHGSFDMVTYTWHSILEAFGEGNMLRTLSSAWLALKNGGVLVFDLPGRENPGIEDGWYYNKINDEIEYLAYVPTEEELKFLLRITGFDGVEIKKWRTKPSELYPEGMQKLTVVARKIT